MKNLSEHVYETIAAICPIAGISIGKADDKATWRIDFAARATEQERQGAVAALLDYDISFASRARAKAEIVALLSARTRIILDAYPEGERLSWDAKEVEAAAFAAAEAPVAADYPMLRGEVAAELAIAMDEVTLEQLADKVEAVLWMASQWRALISALSGIRKRYLTAIDAAEDAAARRAAIEAAATEIGGLAGEARQPLARSGSNA